MENDLENEEMNIFRVNGPPPPYLKENDKKGYFKRTYFYGTGQGIIEYDRTDESYYYNTPSIDNSYAFTVHMKALDEIRSHVKKYGYIYDNNPVTLADLYHKYTYGNFLPGGEFNNYKKDEKDKLFQKTLYENK